MYEERSIYICNNMFARTNTWGLRVRNYAEEEDPEQEEVAIDEAFCMSATCKASC